MLRLLPLLFLLPLSACAQRENHIHLEIIGFKTEAESMSAAAQLTKVYLEQQRFVRVALPNVENPTQEQRDNALTMAVVQPAYLPGSGAIYIACTVHDPIAVDAMLSRCEAELRAIAKESGVDLSLFRS